MFVRLTVTDAEAGTRREIEVGADGETLVGSLLEALPVPTRGRTCYLGAEPLDPAQTLADAGLVPGLHLGIGAPVPQPRGVPAGAVVGVHAVRGTTSAGLAWLPPGVHVVGRAPELLLSLDDAQVSRRHASVTVDPDGGLHIADMGSANGTALDGEPVNAEIPWPAASRVVVGDTTLVPVAPPRDGLRTTPSGDGRLDFDRAFAAVPAVARTPITLPPPEPANRSGWKTILGTALVPLLLGLVMAAMMRQPTMLLFALLGPLTGMSTAVFERRGRKARAAEAAAERARTQERVDAAVADEERRRRLQAPDLLQITLSATGAARGVWPRNSDSPDALVLRLGTTDTAAAVDLQGEKWDGFVDPVLHDVPVTVDLRRAGVFGVVGAPETTSLVTNALVAQLATLRSPEDMRLVLIAAGDGAELAWARWLPHLDGGEPAGGACWVGTTPSTRAARVDELRDLVSARRADLAQGTVGFGQDVVVVLSGALALRHLPGMRDVLRDGPSVGVYVIAVDQRDMNECRGTVTVDGGPGAPLRLVATRDADQIEGHWEGLTPAAAERIGRAVAPLRDRITLAAGESALPYPVRFLDLVEMGAPSSRDVLDRWSGLPGPTTCVPLGADSTGVVTVDVAGQGPHTMLAGATGAGKSILLQTLVTSLLMANRPDELNLVLVDFKGGSAFLPFARCPHVVGLIRSTGETPADVFDEAAAVRVLASVRAEVRRRESLLARFGGEIDEYWRERGRGCDLAPLPRLVLVFDEFARVLETSPDFLKELVNVAAKGRSLGMHLVLATQSLQGKLSAELKNNIDLRITLRQNEAADSVEVLGVPDAVTIPGRLRGRGMILCTKDEVRTPQPFQSGYLGNPPPVEGAAPARVRLVEWSALGLPRPEERPDHRGQDTDQDLAIAAIEAASTALALPAPRRPLLPPLPATLPLHHLPRWTTQTMGPTEIALALVDDPDAQAQRALGLDLAGTDRLLVAGGPQSGRTTAVRSLVTSLVTRFPADRAHLYLIEQNPSGLIDYADLPHCGGVFSPAEPDRLRRLVGWLGDEVQRRATARFLPAAGSDPWIVVIVDGWELIENRTDPTFVETSVLVGLRQVVTAGPPVGVHVVAVGGQAMLSSRVTDLYSRRVLLPFPKEETRRTHLSGQVVVPPVLPGRAVEAGSGMHLQVCLPKEDPARLVEVTTRAAAHADPSRLPRRFGSLPVSVGLRDLATAVPIGPSCLPIGVGGPHVAPVTLDLFEAGPHLLLVSGPEGSGRSTAAIGMVDLLRRAAVGVLVLAPSRSPLVGAVRDDPGVRVLTGVTFKDAELREAAAEFGDGRYAVVLDDCEQITVLADDSGFVETPTLLQEIASPGALGRQALVLCGDAGPILSGQRRSLSRVVNEAMTSGTRVLLTPTQPMTAREMGFSLEADQYFAGPSGRGYITVGRSAQLMQWVGVG